MIILRGRTKEGKTVYYTGKAGEKWISPDINDGFPYSLSGGRAKATLFNKMTPIHGIHFIAIDTEKTQENPRGGTGMNYPTRIQVQTYFDNAQGTVRARLNATEKAFGISNIKIARDGPILTVISFKRPSDFSKNPRTEIRELTLFITNDGNLYRQMTTPIIKNFRRKIAKGTYDQGLALKGWLNLATEGAKRYAKEFGGTYHQMFSMADRRSVAIELADHYAEELAEPLRKNPVTWVARDKRINASKNAVFDLYRDGHFAATVEIRGDAPGGMKVLLGAMQPLGKERAWEAIRRYEGVTKNPRKRVQTKIRSREYARILGKKAPFRITRTRSLKRRRIRVLKGNPDRRIGKRRGLRALHRKGFIIEAVTANKRYFWNGAKFIDIAPKAKIFASAASARAFAGKHLLRRLPTIIKHLNVKMARA